MSNAEKSSAMDALHTPEAIARRVNGQAQHSYLGDFVLGAVDGTVTTFAIVAGVTGAGLSGSIAIILGFANIAADAFSMAASNYLKGRTDEDTLARYRKMEELHIDQVPEAEREEIREIYKNKWFSGELLEEIVEVITSDRERWIETMLTEEWGMRLSNPTPWRSALATFIAFALAGFVPLLPLFLSSYLEQRSQFAMSAGLTGITFFAIGWLQGQLSQQSPLRSALETLGIGSIAALLAYVVGMILGGH